MLTGRLRWQPAVSLDAVAMAAAAGDLRLSSSSTNSTMTGTSCRLLIRGIRSLHGPVVDNFPTVLVPCARVGGIIILMAISAEIADRHTNFIHHIIIHHPEQVLAVNPAAQQQDVLRTVRFMAIET